jgi:hypothetical protein
VERKEVKTVKKKFRRILSGLLALTMLLGVIPTEGNGTVAKAATTASVSLSSLGSKGSISIGSKTKSGTWWKMQLNGKTAFCMNLGYTCHTGNTYGVEEKYTWNQNTGGDKKGYYAKIIRWYVLDGKRTKKSFLMSQALIWSVQEGCNSESQLKDVIKQVKNKMNIYPAKTAAELYKAIFEPDGNWEVTATYWQKTGNSNKYQRLFDGGCGGNTIFL